MSGRLLGLGVWSMGLCLAASPVALSAAEMSIAQRLELLERRAALVTELTLQLDELRRENRELRGQIELFAHQIDQVDRRQRDAYLDVDQRLESLRSQGAARQTPVTGRVAAPGPSLPDPVRATPVAAPAVRADSAAIEAEYQAAYAMLSPQQKRYPEAVVAFERFLAQHAEHPLAPNAQYWLGEAHYVMQQNDRAQQVFERLVSEFPRSDKVPGALFKIGRLQQATGKPEAARASFQRVIDEFPDSSAAGLARQRLEQLGR